MEQLASANVPVGTTLASETREDFTVYTNPLVQIPPIVYASVHSPLEGRIDSPIPPDYGPDAPFGRNSMGQAISEFGVIRPSPGNPPLGEEEHRIINASLYRARNFLERVEIIIPPPVYCHEAILADLPRLSDP